MKSRIFNAFYIFLLFITTQVVSSCGKLVSVRTPQDLDSLSIQTYIIGAIVGLVMVIIAAIISNVIKFEGGANPKDPGKRRRWFWILMIISFSSFYLYNKFLVTPTISPNLYSKFQTTSLIGSAIALATFLIVGFVMSKMFSTGKIGNWFPSKK
ncbi:MAG: hypothetical protein JST55_16545 [Bacteroidetes bacterium]|nr:hypothetical protein [Bacteroidota bacterium]